MCSRKSGDARTVVPAARLNIDCENMRSGKRIVRAAREEGVQPQFRAFPAVMYLDAKGGAPSALTAVAGW